MGLNRMNRIQQLRLKENPALTNQLQMWLYNNHHIGCENKAALKWSRECYQESAISFGWEKCKEVQPNVNVSHTQSQQ